MSKWYEVLTRTEMQVLTDKMHGAYLGSVTPASDECGEIAWELENVLCPPPWYVTEFD